MFTVIAKGAGGRQRTRVCVDLKVVARIMFEIASKGRLEEPSIDATAARLHIPFMCSICDTANVLAYEYFYGCGTPPRARGEGGSETSFTSAKSPRSHRFAGAKIKFGKVILQMILMCLCELIPAGVADGLIKRLRICIRSIGCSISGTIIFVHVSSYPGIGYAGRSKNVQ